MKKVLYIIALMFLGSLGFTRANVNSMNVAPVTQSAISGSSVTFTVTGTNGTGDAYLRYVLPYTSSYRLMYQSANVTPINIGYINPLSPDPIFALPANSNFSITFTAKFVTDTRGFSPITTTAAFGADQRVSTILTSAIAQITPVADLAITNVLTGQNPSFSGDTVYYYITLQNIGSDLATGISFMSNFPISTLATPAATFDGTSQSYNYINYLTHNFVWTGLNTLNPGQTMIIVLNAPMLQNFAVGTTFNQIATTTTASAEYTTGNNSATATGIVQTVANVWVTKTLMPFTGYNSGDKVIYTIAYGNSGGKPATGVVLNDIISSGINIPVNMLNIGTLPAGSGGTLTLTGTLGSLFTSGQFFVNIVTISTTSVESNTGNNSATATGVIQGIANVSVNIIANNLTRPQLDNAPYGSGPAILIQAVSGDVVQLTITYANFGNTIGTNATIGLSGMQGFVSLGAYNGNIGTLLLNTTGTLIVTGIVGPKNYISFVPTARLSYNSNQLRTDSVIIQEPFICGDGLLTRTEVCDTQGNLGVLYSGQVCENQQGICTLRTTNIVNNACINYQYTTPLGVLITGQACDDASLTLAPANCVSMTGSAPVNTSNGFNINLTCKGNNTSNVTPITIDCANGTTLSGVGANFNGTCNYSGSFVGNAQCKVGSDVTNVACRVPVSVNAGQCGALDALDGTIAIVNEAGNADSTFRCETVNHTTAQTITIDCGNGTVHTANNVSIFEAGCEYSPNTIPATYPVKCLVDGVSAPTCQENLIVDKASLGYCGDGIRQGYEKCDLGSNDKIIGDYLDEHGNVDAGNYANNGYTCHNCDIQKKNTETSMVGCFNIGNTNISIQKGELLPFRWTLDNKKNIIAGNTCEGKEDGSIPEESILCTFNIYNGEHTEANNDPVNSSPIVKKCNEDNRGSLVAFQYFLDKQNEWRSLKNAFGKYYIDSNNFIDENSKLGEYKISLDKVSYQYCRSDEKDEGTEIDRVCSVDFAVTKPYLAQKSSFGVTPKAASIKLDGYEMINGDELIKSTDLADIMVLDESKYAGGNKVQTMMDSFITKYSKLAVKYTTVKSKEGNDITVSKVPGQDIVVFKGNGTLTYTEGGAKTKPFTILVDGPSIEINGAIENTNSMFLVNKGNITFLPPADACAKTQVVKGIFVTNKGSFLAGPNLANDSTDKKWCEFGGLKIQGILIGNGIDNLVQSRRSQLNHRFMLGGTSDAAIKVERRNEVFNGASVLIEYSPSLWNALPPGASEFTKVLEIYKQ